MRLALLVCALLAQDPAPEEPTPQAQQPSLEAFLRRARAELRALQTELAERVRQIAARLEEDIDATERARLEDELVALGPEVALLLVPYLEPQPGGTDDDPPSESVRRAERILRVLERLRPAGIVQALAARAGSGTVAGRRNAIRALGAVPETRQASEVLARVYGASGPAERLAALQAAVELGGEETGELLRQALWDDDAEVVRQALDSLPRSEMEAARTSVLALMNSRERSTPIVGALAGFWRRAPELADEEVALALVVLAQRQEIDAGERMEVLEVLSTLPAAERSREVRQRLEPLAASAHGALREAALVALARLGDRGARRELIESYDELVEANVKWPQAYQRRGEALLRVGDARQAARDYEHALELLGDRARQGANRELWIELARAHVRAGRERQAAQVLWELSPTPPELEELAEDPDFQPLREDGRYRDLWD